MLKKQNGRKKSNLDEMQEQKMLHIEKSCFWILYGMLAVTLIVERILGLEMEALAGELICFLAVSAVMVILCIKNGIWDRHLNADNRTHMIASAVGAVVVGILNLVFYYINGYEYYGPLQIILVALLPAVLTFVIAWLVLSICGGFYRKKADKLENEQEDEND